MSRPSHLTTYTDEQYAEMIKRVRANRASKIASSKASNLSFVNVFNVPETVCENIKRGDISSENDKHMHVG
jgi:hypothetical protein